MIVIIGIIVYLELAAVGAVMIVYGIDTYLEREDRARARRARNRAAVDFVISEMRRELREVRRGR